MRQVVDSAQGCFIPDGLNHMDGFLLFRKVSCIRCSDQVIVIGPQVDFGTATTNAHPKSTKHLTRAMTLDKRVQLSNRRRQSGAVDL